MSDRTGRVAGFLATPMARYPATTLWLVLSIALTAWNTVEASSVLLALILALQVVMVAIVVYDVRLRLLHEHRRRRQRARLRVLPDQPGPGNTRHPERKASGRARR